LKKRRRKARIIHSCRREFVLFSMMPTQESLPSRAECIRNAIHKCRVATRPHLAFQELQPRTGLALLRCPASPTPLLEPHEYQIKILVSVCVLFCVKDRHSVLVYMPCGWLFVCWAPDRSHSTVFLLEGTIRIKDCDRQGIHMRNCLCSVFFSSILRTHASNRTFAVRRQFALCSV
jgi:hypothetical protein